MVFVFAPDSHYFADFERPDYGCNFGQSHQSYFPYIYKQSSAHHWQRIDYDHFGWTGQIFKFYYYSADSYCTADCYNADSYCNSGYFSETSGY